MYRISIGILVGLSLHLNAGYAADKEVIRGSSKQLTQHINSYQLKKLNVHTDAQGLRHIRYQQQYEGVPVWGAYVSEHRTLKGKTNTYGAIYNNLKQDLGEKPTFSVDFGPVITDFQAKYPRAKVSVDRSQMMIYVDPDGRAHWACFFYIIVEEDDAPPKIYCVIMNIYTLQVYDAWDTVKTLNKVQGFGFGGNDRIGKTQYGRDSSALHLVRDDAKAECLMQNEFVMIQDMHSTYSGIAPISSFKCDGQTQGYWTGVNQDGYDEINRAYSPTNDALYIGSVIHRMFSEWYHLDPLGRTEDSIKTLVMRVHYGQSYENAFWDGKQMSFGDGGKHMYPLVVASVAAHEIAHGFTEHHSDLVYTGQSGAINESFSDMAAQALEYYRYGKNSWAIGAEAMKDETKALRYMKDPSADGKSINHTKDYYKGLDVHYASGVYNRFFYLLANTKNWNTKKAFDIMLKANVDYWVSTSNYEDAACGVLWAAEDLMYSLPDVQSAFKTVGIDTTQCGV